MSVKERKNLIRILVALVMFVVIFTVDKTVVLGDAIGGAYGWLLPFCLYLIVYVVIGYDVLYKAARNIAHGKVFDENFLMCIATLGAFALAVYRGVAGLEIEGFDEACAVLLFYQVGEWFQRFATNRSRKSVSALMDIRPDRANVVRGGGEVEEVDPAAVEAGDIIVINPGERVPLDGTVISGRSALDTKALTGESLPRDVADGDEVVSGCVNIDSQLKVRVERPFYDSTVSRILELVENASSQKSEAENFITKFARWYTPIVVAVALFIAVVPSAVTGEWAVWVYRALSFLVVSCPCALVISIPLTFFAGIGGASRCGILIKGANFLEKFNTADTFVFDKTGTLTSGGFAVTRVVPEDGKDKILRLAAIAERGSSHPIARSICAAYGGETDEDYTLTDVAGEGITATRGDEVIYCGNAKLMRTFGIAHEEIRAACSVVYVATRRDGYIGAILVSDEVKPETREVIAELNGMGCKTVMLTGDNEAVAASVAAELGLTEYKASLLPQDKVAEVESLLNEKRGGALCFVGDGINDAPALMRSDIGIAMGGVGSDAAIEASDIVLMRDDLRGITQAKRISRKTMGIVRQNIVFSLAIKLAVLVLAACGIANMWLAVFADVGVAVIAILNAMRAMRVKTVAASPKKRELSAAA